MTNMMQQKLINITITIANNLQEKWQQNNITAETLMQRSFAIWDFMLALFNHAFLLYNEINAQYKLTDTVFALFTQSLSGLENLSKYLIHSFYNSDWLYVVAMQKNIMVVIVDFLKELFNQIPSTDEMQQKWTQMNEQYKLTDTAVALFKQSLSVVESISEYLINNSDWIFLVARNLLMVIVDFIKELFNQAPSTNEMQQKWTQMDTQYKLTETAFALSTQSLSALENISGYLIVVIVDLLKVLFNQIPSTDDLQQKWTQMNEQYKLIDTAIALFTQSLSALENIFGYLIRTFNNSDWISVVARNFLVVTVDFIEDLLNQIPSINEIQQNWSQMNEQYKLTDTTLDILNKSLSFAETLLKYMIHFFNNIVPPEKRGEKIPDWLYLGVCFLILVVVLIVCIRNLGSVISMLFMFIPCVVRFLFMSISWLFNVFHYPVSAAFRWLGVCLLFGGKSAVKMMKAPGKPTVLITRAVFEANPQEYFANLRGKL